MAPPRREKPEGQRRDRDRHRRATREASPLLNPSPAVDPYRPLPNTAADDTPRPSQFDDGDHAGEGTVLVSHTHGQVLPTVTFLRGDPPPEVRQAVRAIIYLIATLDHRLASIDGFGFESPPCGVSADDLAAHTSIERCPVPLRGSDCVVCCTTVNGRYNVRKLRCGHAFHPSCIDRWLDSHDNCPLCRATVVPEVDAPAL
jgi:hypothetical protein